MGVAWYVGAPRTGKTTLALEHLCERIEMTRWPALIIDTSADPAFAAYPHADCRAGVTEALWRHRTSIAFTPEGPADVEALCQIAAAGRCIHLLVDDASTWLSARSSGPGSALLRLLRTYRHAAVSVGLTSHHLSGDVPQAAFACAPTLYAFATRSSSTLDRLRRVYGVDPAVLLGLQPFQYLRLE